MGYHRKKKRVTVNDIIEPIQEPKKIETVIPEVTAELILDNLLNYYKELSGQYDKAKENILKKLSDCDLITTDLEHAIENAKQLNITDADKIRIFDYMETNLINRREIKNKNEYLDILFPEIDKIRKFISTQKLSNKLTEKKKVELNPTYCLRTDVLNNLGITKLKRIKIKKD